AFQTDLVGLIPLVRPEADRREAVRLIHRQFQLWFKEAGLPEIDARAQAAPRAVSNPGNRLFGRVRADVNQFVQGSSDALESLNGSARVRRLLQMSGFVLLGALAIGFLVASSWRNYRLFRDHLERAESAVAQNRAIIDNSLDGVITADE